MYLELFLDLYFGLSSRTVPIQVKNTPIPQRRSYIQLGPSIYISGLMRPTTSRFPG